MSGQTTAVIRGRMHGVVQLRHTERGTPAARFTVVQVPREYDRARGSGATPSRSPSSAPSPARSRGTSPNASPTRPALRDNQLHLDSAQVGVDLAHHVAYIDDILPAVLAGRTPAPRSAAFPRPRNAPSRPARPHLLPPTGGS